MTVTTRWNVADYIREEVQRQGHNLAVQSDGGNRVRWMTNAWKWAQLQVRQRGLGCKPNIDDAEHIGTMIEPGRNIIGFRVSGVRVGLRVCPDPADVVRLLSHLFSAVDELSPLEWYKQFELIHP